MHIINQALTFDDVLLVPSYSEILPSHVSLKTQLTKKISLNIPIMSAAMDTVTEANLAIAIAQEGGMGVIHKNLLPEEQAKHVSKVKRFESGILKDPITVFPHQTIGDVLDLANQHGFSGFPVIDVQSKKVVGIITNRDMRFEMNLNSIVADKMTPASKLISIHIEEDLAQAKQLMHEHRLERVLVVNDYFELAGLITAKDIQKANTHPNACKDEQGRLLVAAAVGIHPNNQERIALLIQAHVDAIVVDTAHGHSKGVLEQVRWIKNKYPHIQIIAGNIATAEAAIALAKAGADAVKVGIGPGSICTTRIIAGVGIPQITAVSDVAQALKGSDVGIIADGGIRYSGDVAKAIAAGAHCVMMGGMFAGTEEAPGEVFLYQGRSYKSYRGMGSVGAMKDGSADRYFQDARANTDKLVPEGIEGRVPYKGSVVSILAQLAGGVRASMGYCGCADITNWHQNAKFVQITAAGMRESHVHDVQIMKEAPNYHANN
jgi:IMP dehydrogenase